MKRILVTLSALTLMALPTVAQDALPENAEVVVEGLNFPRGLFVDADGSIYLAESGAGGDQVISADEGAGATSGLSGQVAVIAADGTTSAAWDNVPSIFSEADASGFGLYRVYPQGDSLWVVLGDYPGLLLAGTIVQIDRATQRILTLIDPAVYENANDTDGTTEIYSNPGDLAWDAEGNLYILDTGANTLFTWTPEAGLSPFIVWNDNPIPSSVEFAPDGTIYISFFGPEIAPGAGFIEHRSADGTEVIETFSDLTAVSDIELAADGTLYAVQLITGFGETGPLPGSVIAVSAEGVTSVAEGLMTPFGIDSDAAGNLYVTTGTSFAAPGSGAVIRITPAA